MTPADDSVRGHAANALQLILAAQLDLPMAGVQTIITDDEDLPPAYHRIQAALDRAGVRLRCVLALLDQEPQPVSGAGALRPGPRAA